MNRPHPWTILVIVAALGGFFFASYSTYDFVAHLDRQVHGIHCSFLPGIEGTDATGSTGCHTTLMSPYSSVMRSTLWGGMPVSLPAMGVFAFLAFFAASLSLLGRQRDPRATLFLMLATLLPVLTSLVMGYLSLVTLDAACKLCIGIYLSSFFAFVGALMLWLRARKPTRVAAGPADATQRDVPPIGWGRLGLAFAVGIAFVMVPAVVYAAAAPDFERYIGECGELAQMPSQGMLVPLGPQDRDVGVVEVFDPLCPACRGFEERFGLQAASAEVSRQVLLFPLDDACNWMVDDAIHAGACAISEAILCATETAGVTPEEVIEWAFAEQKALREATEADAQAAARQAGQKFPSLASCIGSPQVRARLNVGLRYAVANQMPIVTPQVFVNGVRMCDEDTDLGMDYALRRLVDKAHADGARPPAPERESFAAPAPSPRPRRAGDRETIQLRPRTERGAAPAPDEGSAQIVDGVDDDAAATDSAAARDGTAPVGDPAAAGEADTVQPGSSPTGAPLAGSVPNANSGMVATPTPGEAASAMTPVVAPSPNPTPNPAAPSMAAPAAPSAEEDSP